MLRRNVAVRHLSSRSTPLIPSVPLIPIIDIFSTRVVAGAIFLPAISRVRIYVRPWTRTQAQMRVCGECDLDANASKWRASESRKDCEMFHVKHLTCSLAFAPKGFVLSLRKCFECFTLNNCAKALEDSTLSLCEFAGKILVH